MANLNGSRYPKAGAAGPKPPYLTPSCATWPRLAATVMGIAVGGQVIQTTIVTDKPPDPLPSLYPSF